MNYFKDLPMAKLQVYNKLKLEKLQELNMFMVLMYYPVMEKMPKFKFLVHSKWADE